MNDLRKKFLYRIFCVIALLIAAYVAIDLKISGTLEVRMIAVFILLIIVILWGLIDWKSQYEIMKKQEEELKMYQLYIQPLEELVKDIRVRQHEFDNHMNAILNMHVTIDNYEELVASQLEYARLCVQPNNREFIPLLKISDKILAGFLYSKLISNQENVYVELEVCSQEIVSKISEHDLIEIIGTLVDNAYEACTKEKQHVIMSLDSREDKIYFEIKNQFNKIPLEEIGRFFEKGYSTKGTSGNRGFGLYNAKMIVQKYQGEITVEVEYIGGENYITFKVII
ncbi:MAG: GHKL domain-containing protein [Lachnospiraceae bacterium]